MGSKNRLQSLDILRGFMILYVIFLHAIIQRVFTSQGSEFETTVNNIPLIFTILMAPIIIMSIWGPIFTFIGGIATGYNLGNVDSSELARKARIRFAGNVMLFLIAKVDIFLFSGRTRDHTYSTTSLLTGALENGQLTLPEFLHMFTNNTLGSMAISGMFLTLLLYRMGTKKNTGHSEQIAKRLVILGIVVLLISELFRVLLTPENVLAIKQTLWDNGDYLNYALFLKLYASRFAFFPVFAFSLFGGSIGVLIAARVPFQKLARWTFGLGSGLIGIFFASFIHGFDLIGTYADEMLPMQMQCLNLGLQMMLFGVLYYFFDVRSKPVKKSKIRNFFYKYSNLSMSIYILEGFVAQSWYAVFHFLHRGPFSDNFPLIVAYLATVLATWQVIVNLWTKFGNRGSFEWLLLKGRNKILTWNQRRWWKQFRVSSPSHHYFFQSKGKLIENY